MIIVNNNVVNDSGTIDDLIESKHLDVNFVLIQSTTTSGFSANKICTFGYGAKNFFSLSNSTSNFNRDVQSKMDIVKKIYDNSHLFRRQNPRCFLYYATTGKWEQKQGLVSCQNSVISDMRKENLFQDVIFECLGANELQTLFHKTRNSISKTIKLESYTPYPNITDVEQAYIGLLPSAEFMKLVTNNNGDIIKYLFFDNVRDWQGWNPVNKKIKLTLESKKQLFSLLNNGVTIVCENIRVAGKNFTLEDYQIVNGCQTSYVLYELKSELDDNVMIPIRLIATNNSDIRNSIIQSTNTQTSISEEQISALSDFAKKLELHFQSYENDKQLYYERRSRQYATDRNVTKTRVITVDNLVKAFCSIFFELPHRTSRNYRSLTEKIGKDFFTDSDIIEMYYTAAYAHYRLEYLYRSQKISTDLKPARYHLLLAFRLLNSEQKNMPRQNAREMKNYCEKLMELLWDDDKTVKAFNCCAELVKTVAEDNLTRNHIHTEGFTKKLIQHITEINCE